MTLPPDDRTPLSRDADFERHYRAGSQEMPGAVADAAVLALARAAAAESRLRTSAAPGARDPGARGWPGRWQASLALAACLVLAVGVVTRMQTQLPETSQVANSVPHPVAGAPASPAAHPAAESASVATATPSRPRSDAPRMQPPLTASAERIHDPRPAVPAAAEALSAPVAPPMMAPQAAPQPQLRGTAADADRRPESAEASAAKTTGAAGAIPGDRMANRPTQQQPQNAASTMAREAGAARKPDVADDGTTALDESMLTPQAWLARILELRSKGRHVEADASVRRFRERHPSIQVPQAASGQTE